MSSLGFGIAHCRRRTTFHHRKHPQISPRRSASVRPKRTDQVSLGRRRKQTIQAMRAVVQRVASASVEVVQRNYEVLLVSQFTLFGILKGNKPDFQVAMPPDVAKPFYASVVEKFQKAYRVDATKGMCVCVRRERGRENFLKPIAR
ncbi:D-tyrosyl-tRNA(Tyr) deacylase, partial [Striga asiatica]